MSTNSDEEDSLSWEDLYSVQWIPKEIFVKFRQKFEGYQLGANFEFDGMQVNGCNTKLVLKSLASDWKWKFLCEPRQLEMRLLSKKIPIGSLLSLQVGIRHDFRNHETRWHWKLSSSFGITGTSQIQHKTSLHLFPGFDIRVGWNAEYVLPDIHGGAGTSEATVGMEYGHLHASIERIEAIFTNVS